MAKKKISIERKRSAKKLLTEHIPFKSHELKNKKTVAKALIECIRHQDTDSFREVLMAHLMTVNKSQFAKQAGLGRRTVYDIMDVKKKFNPELSTVSSIIKALSA